LNARRRGGGEGGVGGKGERNGKRGEKKCAGETNRIYFGL